MNNILNKKILYLDDKQDYLRKAATFFSTLGCDFSTTQSIDYAVNKVKYNEFDIFICDLKLNESFDQIDLTGNKILKGIRKSNRNVYLALYTAYKNTLKEEEIQLLELNNISIFEKGDNTAFALNLNNDYESFLQKLEIGKSKFKDEVSIDVKIRTLNHLRGVTNQSLTVPIEDGKLFYNLTIREIIREVEDESKIGSIYVKMWLDALTIINKNKENGKKKKYFIF